MDYIGLYMDPVKLVVKIYNSLWIQLYLLRKYDWGMIYGVSCTFSDSLWIQKIQW